MATIFGATIDDGSTTTDNPEFSTIVVPLDLEPSSGRACVVASALAAASGRPTQLITVTSPGLDPLADRRELASLAHQHHLDQAATIVLHSNEPSQAIAAHVAEQAGPLVVLATSACGPFGERFGTSNVAELLRAMATPVLALGPHLHDIPPPRLRLASCSSPDAEAEQFADPIRRWLNTFPWCPPVVVESVPDANPVGPASHDAAAHVQRVAHELSKTLQGACEWELLRASNAVDALLAYADDHHDLVFVTAPERWSDPTHVHLHSVSRRLVHESPVPVLLLPHHNTDHR